MVFCHERPLLPPTVVDVTVPPLVVLVNAVRGATPQPVASRVRPGMVIHVRATGVALPVIFEGEDAGRLTSICVNRVHCTMIVILRSRQVDTFYYYVRN